MYIGSGIRCAILVAALVLGSQAFAADPATRPAAGKHQMLIGMNTCMKRRMAADQYVSYNGAMKVCKDQVNKRAAAQTYALIDRTL